MRKLLAIFLILLSSCSFRVYDSDVKVHFPNGTLYKINDRSYLMEKDGVIYYIEYFKGEKYITTVHRL